MASRLDLQTKLVELLGKKSVYFQPPENLKMEYPAIRYSVSKIESIYANDSKYSNFTRYEIIVIYNEPTNDTARKILELPYSSYDRHYKSDNLNHDVLTLYF